MATSQAPGTPPTGSGGTEGARPAGRDVSRGESRHGRRHHAPAARERRPLRAPDPPLEPEDEALHLHRAQRHLHHRPAAVADLHRPRLRVRQGDRRPRRHRSCSSAPRSRPRRRSPSRRPASGMPYVNQRWLGGMLTNFQTVHKRLQRLKELEEIDFDDVAGSGMTKKELLVLRREKDKLERTLGGIRDMTKVPSAVWIVDTKKEHLAVDEARKLGIPVIAILDTNCDPDEVDYPIPGNDDAIRSVTLLTRVVADAVAEGLMARAARRRGRDRAGRRRRRRAAGRVGARAARAAEAGGRRRGRAVVEAARSPRPLAVEARRRSPRRPPPRLRRVVEAARRPRLRRAAEAAAGRGRRRSPSRRPAAEHPRAERPSRAGTAAAAATPTHERGEARSMANYHRRRRQEAPRADRRRHDGLQEGARGGRRRLRQGRRDPARQGPQGRRQAGGPHDVQRPGRRARRGGVGTLVELNCETDFVAKGDDVPGARRRRSLDAGRRRPAPPTPRRCWPVELAAGKTVPGADRRGQRDDRREDRAPPGRPARGARRRRLPAPHQPRPARRRSASSSRTDGGERRRPRRRACTSPRCARRTSPATTSPAEVVANERRIAEATAREEGKPEAALPKIVEGRVNGFFKENVLLEQPFAKDTKKTVQQVLDGGRRHGHRLRPVPGRRLSPAASAEPPDRRTSHRTPSTAVPRGPHAAGSRTCGRGRARARRPAASAPVGARPTRGPAHGGDLGWHRSELDAARVIGAPTRGRPVEPARRSRHGLGTPGPAQAVRRGLRGGGRLGVDPDVVSRLAAPDRRGRPRGRPGRRRRRRRQLLPRRRAVRSAAWTGPAPTTWACSAR